MSVFSCIPVETGICEWPRGKKMFGLPFCSFSFDPVWLSVFIFWLICEAIHDFRDDNHDPLLATL